MRRLLIAGGGGSVTIPTLYPPTDASWTRSASNPILTGAVAWEGGWVQEPTVLNLGDGYLTMFYTGGTNPNYGMGRATCPIASDPTVPANWTKYASNPVLGQGGSGYAGVCSRNEVIQIGSTLYCYFGDGTDLYRSTSTDSGITWTTPTLTLTAATVGGGATQLTNTSVWRESSSDWRMLLEVVGGTWYDRIGYWTSTDGLSWTPQNGGVYISSLLVVAAPDGASMGPSVIKEGSTYHLWFHANPGTSGLPQDGYHATSTDLLTWTISGRILTHQGPGTFEYDQAVDLYPVVVSGTAYLFYTGANNTTNEGGPLFKIGVASAPAVP